MISPLNMIDENCGFTPIKFCILQKIILRNACSNMHLDLFQTIICISCFLLFIWYFTIITLLCIHLSRVDVARHKSNGTKTNHLKEAVKKNLQFRLNDKLFEQLKSSVIFASFIQWKDYHRIQLKILDAPSKLFFQHNSYFVVVSELQY